MHVQDALAASDCMDLESLGDQADLIMAHPHCQILPVCAVLPTEDYPDSPTEDSHGQEINCLLPQLLLGLPSSTKLRQASAATTTTSHRPPVLHPRGTAPPPAPFNHHVLGVRETPLWPPDGTERPGARL